MNIKENLETVFLDLIFGNRIAVVIRNSSELLVVSMDREVVYPNGEEIVFVKGNLENVDMTFKKVEVQTDEIVEVVKANVLRERVVID